MKKINKGFTLIELIIVVAITGILATIVFITTTANIKDSRDAVRINDILTLEEGLKIYHIDSGKYPKPTDSTEVSFSGGILWYQGLFGDNSHINLSKTSKKPLDPKFGNEYNYSVTNNYNKYQFSTILEGDTFVYSNILPKANALSSSEIYTFVTGDYGNYDLLSKNNSNCFLISTPSLFISNQTFTGNIDLSSNYNYVLNNSNNITNLYQSKLIINTTFDDFQPKEVYNKCSINNVDEFNLYLSKLSLAYQQLNGNNNFKNVIYDYNKLSFRQSAIDSLILNGISVSQDVIDSINNPSAGNIFRDSFNGIDNTELVGSYTTETYGSWSKSINLNNSSYLLSTNNLKKNDNIDGVITPIPILPITSIDRSILFDIKEFAGGSIIIYSNYIDENNFYGIEFNSSGYSIIHKIGGVNSGIYPLSVAGTIDIDSQIEFTIAGNNIKLIINNIEKENIIDATANLNGNPAINLNNQNAMIDNFTLIYK